MKKITFSVTDDLYQLIDEVSYYYGNSKAGVISAFISSNEEFFLEALSSILEHPELWNIRNSKKLLDVS